MPNDPSFLSFLELVRDVSSETQKALAGPLAFLEEIDRLFVDWLPGGGKVRPASSAVLIINSHASFRAALCLALSGQLIPVFMSLRGSIESVLYANAIVRTPDLQQVWLNRHESAEAKQACRSAFSIKKVFEALAATQSQEFSNSLQDAYESTIDFGAHPNSRLILQSTEINNSGGNNSLSFAYIHGHGSTELRRSLVACAEVGFLTFCTALICSPDHPNLRELNDRALVIQDRLPAFIGGLGLSHG